MGNKYLIPILLWIIFFVSAINPAWSRSLTYLYTALTMIQLLDKLGKGIVLRESAVFFFVFTCLLMPIFGYEYYNIDNYLARIFYKYMMVSELDYFSFMLPSIALFGAIVCWPSLDPDNNDSGTVFLELVEVVKEKSDEHFAQGLLIIFIGVVMSITSNYLPTSLQFFVNLFFFSSFAGFLYVFYAKKTVTRSLVMFLFSVFILVNALSTSMFTIVVYMGITMFSFIYLGKKTSLIKKVVVVFVGLFLFVSLQNVKYSYRTALNDGSTENKGILFVKLLTENIQKGSSAFQKDALFPVFIRANQGFNTSLVMRKFPRYQEFDNGKRLFEVFISAFVPRFLWPNKPEAGGKFNMKYYAGITIEGWSTNIGPAGEAYGSFGTMGGIAWMGLLGLFVRLFYFKTLKIAKTYPLLLCWFPLLFYQITYAAETDALQILNSLTKSAFFIWLLFKTVPHWFGRHKPDFKPAVQQPSNLNITPERRL